MTDLIVGAWREGLPREQAQMLEEIEARERQGFRQLPSEALQRDLARLLDAYDVLADELLQEDVCDCIEEVIGESCPPVVLSSAKKGKKAE